MNVNRRYGDVFPNDLARNDRVVQDGRGLARRAVNEGVPLDELPLRSTDNAGYRADILAIARQTLENIAGMKFEQPGQREEEREQVIEDPAEISEEGEIAEEEFGQLKEAIKARFESKENGSNGSMTWEEIERSLDRALRERPDVINQLVLMEKAGMEPRLSLFGYWDLNFGCNDADVGTVEVRREKLDDLSD